MSAKDNGGPAFPCECGGDPSTNEHQTGNHTWQQYGMTVRDAFAKEAMHGAIAGHISHYGHESNHWQAKDIASYAYEMADAMLEARKQ